MTLPLKHPLGYAECIAVAARASVDYRTVKAYLVSSRTQRAVTVQAIERALRALGFVAKRPRHDSAASRTLSLPFDRITRPKGGDEES